LIGRSFHATGFGGRRCWDRIFVGDAVKNHVTVAGETPITFLDFTSLCADQRSIGKPLEMVMDLS